MDKMTNEVKRMNKKCEELLLSKNKDYSSDNLIKTGKQGIASRIVDKAHRLLNLSNSKDVNHETVEDTLMDLINYAHLFNIRDKKLLKPKRVMAFLSGPIDDVDHRTATHWRKNVAHALRTIGVSSFDPSTAYSIAHLGNQDYVSEHIININKAALDECDFVIAHLGGLGKAFGTIREIEYARLWGKEVIVVGDIVSLSAYDCVVVPDFDTLFQYLGINETFVSIQGNNLCSKGPKKDTVLDPRD